MLHKELMAIGEPVLAKVLAHPFWSGLRDGTLPGEALAHFVRQDTAFLLPAYARALARCAASATDDADTHLFGQSIIGTLEAAERLRQAYTGLTGELGLPALDGGAPVAPATHAHASFFAAAGARSFHAGVGALLPMVWFNAEVSDNLRRQAAAGSRYLPWIEVYHPGESYRYAVQAFLDMADRAGEECSPAQRRLVVEQFSISIRYEWAFAESCIQRSSWPV
ncbi:aminopyrimidine aminohydrolase [Microtetraspora sp. NBRC 13810]|uniref:TenA family protein n=1 Tax=Microtetraspora sp. NBRC 13810 TaxID=3030990 RepID=UPI0024A0CC69|nr:TenA family transcriptional regulator [Microtetraspora sp. NBRC 13810]GLW06792.1 aminopyrimidine aminohydrolase [Microtetraspora sp. NBRC 13810]